MDWDELEHKQMLEREQAVVDRLATQMAKFNKPKLTTRVVDIAEARKRLRQND